MARRPIAIFLATVAWSAVVVSVLAARGQRPSAVPPLPAVTVVAVDAQGRPVPTLGPGDFDVTVDGAARPVAEARFVLRGQAAEAAAQEAATASGRPALVERERTVVIVVDEAGFPREDNKPVRQLVGALVDRLLPGDRAAVVRLPRQTGDVKVTADRKPARQAVGKVSGRADDARAVQPEAPLAVNDGEGRLAPRYVSPSGNEMTEQEDPLAVFARLLGHLANIPGPKTVLLVSPVFAPAADARPAGRSSAEVARCIDAAASAHAVVHAVILPRKGRPAGSPGFEQVALASGGSVLAPGQDDRALDPLGPPLSGYYVLTLEAPAGGRAVHDLRVTTRRQGVQVRAPRRWAGDSTAAGVAAVEPAPAPAAAAGGKTSPEPPGKTAAEEAPAPVTDVELQGAMAHVDAYLRSYARDYTNVVAEERYDQRLEQESYDSLLPGAPRPADASTVTRVLRSDLLMVSSPSLGRWVPFRDVFEVDGKPVRDRDDRLKKLLLDAPKDVAGDARRITEESARYNLGAIDRTTNVPTLALEVLSAGHRGSLRLFRRDEETVEGIRAMRIDFEERADRALIRTTTGAGLPSRGSFWVDPATGRILRTVMRTDVAGAKMEVSVLYRPAGSTGLWLPAEMRESYTQANQKLSGVARYSHYRRFQVTTDEVVK